MSDILSEVSESLTSFYEACGHADKKAQVIRVFLEWATGPGGASGAVFYECDASYDFSPAAAHPQSESKFYADHLETIVDQGVFARALSSKGATPCEVQGQLETGAVIQNSILLPWCENRKVYGLVCLYFTLPTSRLTDSFMDQLYRMGTFATRMCATLEFQSNALESETDLKAYSTLRKHLFGHMHESVLVLDADWNIQEVNTAFLRLTHETEENLVDRNMDSLLHEESRPAFERFQEWIHNEGEVRNIELGLKQISGEKVSVSCSGSSILNEDHMVEGYVFTLADLTEIRGLIGGIETARTEMQRTASDVEAQIKSRTGDLQERLKAVAYLSELHASVLQNMSSGVVVLDPDLKVTLFNRAASVITGIEDRGIMEKNLAEFKSLAPLTTFCRDVLRQRRNASGEDMVIQHTGGGDALLSLSSALLYSALKEIQGVVVVFSDLTQIREMHRKVLANERMAALGKMAAGVAHEIRNPLNVMRGLAEIITKKDLPVEKIKNYMGTVIGQIDRLEILLKEIVDFIKQREPCLEQNDLEKLVRDITEIYREGFLAESGKNINLQVEGTGKPLPLIYFDRDQVQQIMFNLIKNAVDAIGEEGAIRLLLIEEERVVRLTVEDSGCGIDAAHTDQVLEPFFTTKRTQGTGLGLSIVKSIMDLHRGTIHIESKLGEGTRIHLSFPKEA